MSKASHTPLLSQPFSGSGPEGEGSFYSPRTELYELDRAYSPGVSRMEREYRIWSFKNPDATKVPARFTPYFSALERQHLAEGFQVVDDKQGRQLRQIQTELERDLPGHNRRREQELALADFVRDKVARLGAMEYRRGDKACREDPNDIAAKLSGCRQGGQIGLKPGGGYVVAYDEKCGYSKLCPDEAREESQRLAEVYIPAITAFLKQHRGNTFQYAVFTLPNYRAGGLAKGKSEVNRMFKQLMERKCFDHVAGCLVIQEDPLSQHGDWNVHLNVLLAIDGPFDWKAVRESWGFNVHFDSADEMRRKTRASLERKGIDVSRMDTVTVLAHAFKELSKYAGAPVSSKSADKAGNKSSSAPPMTEWPAALWREWWIANKGFRRTRSYGVLYDPEGYRWKVANSAQRRTWLAAADLEGDKAAFHWRKKENTLTKDERAVLRDVMNEREVLNMDQVEWVGTMRYEVGHGYRVHIDLIPEDKLGGPGGVDHGISSNFPTGPPQDDGYMESFWSECYGNA